MDSKDGHKEAISVPREDSRNVQSNLPEELSYLITAFLPSHSPATRSKSYLTLSAFCQGVRSSSSVRNKHPDPATENIVKAFGPLVVSRVTDTEESALLIGVSFLAALFQVDWESASSIFQQDGILEAVMDSVDLTPSPQLALSVVQLLSQACGHKGCRAILDPQAIQWIEAMSHISKDNALRAGATNALIKLSKGLAADNSESIGVSSKVEEGSRKDEDLAAVMKKIVIDENDLASVSDAVEGLAYLSIDPSIKETLSSDPTFLGRLFAHIPHHGKTAESATPTSTIVFGILTITSNICAYRHRLTEEQAQIEKLRGMAKGSASRASTVTSIFDDDEHVRARVHRLLGSGVLNIFPKAVRIDSIGIKAAIGKILLSIVEDKSNRGKVLQSGGAKVLAQIIKYGVSATPIRPSTQTPNGDSMYLEPIQALAKLAITSSPVQVFGPNDGAIYDMIRPMSLLLQHSSSTLLQRFESMMALTNLSSHNAETASRIAQAEGLVSTIELLLLEEHTLVRRAAMELLCNLIAGSNDVFEKYGGGRSHSGVQAQLLQVVMALSDVDDLPTRLAASGAIATLTSAESACRTLVHLQLERHRVFPILSQLIDPSTVHMDDTAGENEVHPGLIHRAIVSARNIFLSVSDQGLRRKLSREAEESGLLQALVKVVKGELGEVGEAVLRLTAEVLKVLMDSKGQ